MKIVQVANHFRPCLGGVERVVEDISSALVKNGHKVKVVCLNRCAYSTQNLAEEQTISGLDIKRVPFLDLKYYKFAPGVLGNVGGAEVVHVHGIGFFSDFLLLTKFIHGKKVVISTHGGIFHTTDIGLLKKFYFWVLQRFILKFADGVIAVSKNDYELFSKICSKTVLIENGLNLSGFYPAKKKPGTFLFVGRFSRNKRVEKLLETFALLGSKKNQLIIAGVDWENLLGIYRAEVRELGLEGRVRFAINPTKEELAALYAGSEYFVSASRYEGFGLSLIEAMACGCIPVVQRNAGFSSIIRKGEGFFVDFDESEEAKKQIEQIFRKNNTKIGKAAEKRAKDFELQKNIASLEKLYGEIV